MFRRVRGFFYALRNAGHSGSELGARAPFRRAVVSTLAVTFCLAASAGAPEVRSEISRANPSNASDSGAGSGEESSDIERLRIIQGRHLTPEQYHRALEATGMLAAKQAEWEGTAAPAAPEAAGAAPLGPWSPIGPIGNTGIPGVGNGRAQAIQIVATGASSYDIYIGGSAGGIWRQSSANPGVWSPIGDTLPDLDVGALNVDPNATNRIVVGTGNDRNFGSGIYYSTDGGSSWSSAAILTSTGFPMTPVKVSRIVRSPSNANILVAASSGGILRSIDGGANWVQPQDGVGMFVDLVVHPTNFQTQYAVSVDPPNSGGIVDNPGVYRSTDGGQTWPTRFDNSTDSDIPMEANFAFAALAICRDAPNALALLVADRASPTTAVVLRTTDGGTSWADITSNLATDLSVSQIFHARAIAFRPTDPNEIFVGSDDLEKTTDANAASPTWTEIDFGHPDVTQLYFADASGDSALWITNDGGVYRRAVGGVTVERNGDTVNGLQVSELIQVAAADTMVVSGAQDNRINRSLDGGTTWTYHTRSDGNDVEITDDLAQEFYAGYGGVGCCNSVNRITPTENVQVAQLDADSGFLFFDRLRGKLYRQGVSPDSVLSQGLPASLNNWSLEFVPGFSDAATLHGSYLDGTLFVTEWSSRDGGTGKVTVARPNGSGGWNLSTINPGPNNTNSFRVRASLERLGESWMALENNSGPGSPVLLHTDDYWQSWTDVSGSLSANMAKVEAIVVMPFDQEEIYVGTPIGIFRSINGGATWQPFQTGMPIVRVTDLTLIKRTTGTDTLVASTWGRGIWTRDISARPLVYVDDRNTDVENGTLEHPYNAFLDGHDAVPVGGTVALHGDSYLVAPLTITKPMTLRAYESDAYIGP